MAEGRWDFTLSSADTMIARTTTDGVDYMLFMQAEEGLSAYLIGQPGFDSIDKLRGKLLAGDPGDSNLDLIRKENSPQAWHRRQRIRHRNHRQLAGALGGVLTTPRGRGDVDAAGFRQSVGRGWSVCSPTATIMCRAGRSLAVGRCGRGWWITASWSCASSAPGRRRRIGFWQRKIARRPCAGDGQGKT